MASMGASVFSGITLTKLVGIAVLAVAPSHLFRVYFFRMYTCLIVVGAFVGLAFLPVCLSLWGPKPVGATRRLHDSMDDDDAGGEEGRKKRRRRKVMRKKETKKD